MITLWKVLSFSISKKIKKRKIFAIIIIIISHSIPQWQWTRICSRKNFKINNISLHVRTLAWLWKNSALKRTTMLLLLRIGILKNCWKKSIWMMYYLWWKGPLLKKWEKVKNSAWIMIMSIRRKIYCILPMINWKIWKGLLQNFVLLRWKDKDITPIWMILRGNVWRMLKKNLKFLISKLKGFSRIGKIIKANTWNKMYLFFIRTIIIITVIMVMGGRSLLVIWGILRTSLWRIMLRFVVFLRRGRGGSLMLS